MYSRSLGREKSKTHKTALCIIPPKQVWGPIQAIRKKHDRQFYRWMPHINLLYPFKPKTYFPYILDVLYVTASKISSFSITLESFNCFSHGKKNHTIWLEVEPQKKIEDLQKKLWEDVPECDDLHKFESGFTPHLSIGQCKGKEKTMRLMESLQSNWKPMTFQLSELSLIWRRDPPNDKFKVGEIVNLGSK